ncbi:MAG: phosphopantetheine-binding protein [Clostridiales bacterium]|jgi:acyl carrier protein|nr:phosphopantetheine-binding protein [Clostridiales bacterium]
MEKLLEALRLAKPTVDLETLKKSKDLYGQGIIDSFDILVIIDEINAAFGTHITGAGFSRNEFRTVDSIYEMVKKHDGV